MTFSLRSSASGAALLVASAVVAPGLAAAQVEFDLVAPVPGRSLRDPQTRATLLPISDDTALAAVQLRDANVLAPGQRFGIPSNRAGAWLFRTNASRLTAAVDQSVPRVSHGLEQNVRTIRAAAALPGGDVILTRSEPGPEEGTLAHAELVRLDPSGTVRWALRPSSRRTDHSHLDAVFSASGQLFFWGRFKRGSYQLPGGPAWRSGRWFTKFVGELDPATGRVLWARTVQAGNEETYLAPTSRGTVLYASHTPRRGRQRHDVIVRELGSAVDGRGGEVLHRCVWATPEDDFPLGIHPYPDGGFALLVGTSRRGTSGGQALQLIGMSPTRQQRFQIEVPDFSILGSGAGDQAQVLAPGPLERIANTASSLLVSDRLAVLSVSASGAREERWLAPPTGGRFHWTAPALAQRAGASWVALTTESAEGALRFVVAPVSSLPRTARAWVVRAPYPSAAELEVAAPLRASD